MEAKAQLAEYRSKKKKEQASKSTLLQRFFGKANANPNASGLVVNGEQSNKNNVALQPSRRAEEAYRTENKDTPLFTLPNVLKLSLWVVLFGLFVELEFGSVYFILSLFYFVYLNMRTGTRKPDEPSAYSVFNPNCERIDGTLSAEQFEQELKYGSASVGR